MHHVDEADKPKKGGLERESVLEDEASDKQVSAQAAISCAVKAGVTESFSQFFGTEAEEDKKKKRKHHKIRASEAFGKFGSHATGPEFEAAAAAAEKRHRRGRTTGCSTRSQRLPSTLLSST